MPIIPVMPQITSEIQGMDTLEERLLAQIQQASRERELILETDPDERGFLRLTLPEGNNVLKMNRAVAIQVRDLINKALEKSEETVTP